MSSKETGELIFGVITSWQVIVVTVVLVSYVFLVSSVSRLSRKKGAKKIASTRPRKMRGSAPMPSADEATREGEDELGLEEESSGSG
jgi:flagellar biosynthesis/type III secretory pathway M-ring protein FliF/YscJ